MSGAILYVAIVAIWAAVLMPRWLRPRSGMAGADGEATDLVDTAGTVIDEVTDADDQPLMVETADPEWVETASPWSADAAWERIGEEADRREEESARPTSGARQVAEPVPRPRQHPVRSRAHQRARVLAQRRARTLRARRRMLITLLLLTAVAAGLAYAHLAALWVVAPPVGVLFCFLVLLREAANSDAKQNLRRTQAARAQHRARLAREAERTKVPAPVEAAAPAMAMAPSEDTAPPDNTVYAVRRLTPRPEPRREPEPTAQVINISQRRRTDVYDQYTDAAHRAVGD
ncbi:MAG TPA: hypothetical protein VGS19_11500 [Streptosporangiaceae bacterium]|nr:hypothetical protein [Streptosporangiaceae bacterium]